MSLIGSWVRESHEHLDKYMQEEGVPDEMIQKILSLKPSMTLAQSGDEFTLARKDTLRGERPPLKFKHMQEVHSKSINLQKTKKTKIHF